MRRSFPPGTVVAIGLVVLALYSIRHTVSSTTLLVFAVVVPSIILHEVAHGVAALAFGDDTARRAGRITLNPIRHIDPVGTLVLPGLLALAGFGAFGYAKPVPVNPARMRHPRNNAVVVSLAGPATNLALAAASVLALRFARPPGTTHAVSLAVHFFGLGYLDVTDRVLFLVGFLNIILAVFNALPVPPLDGSAVLTRLLPARVLPSWYSMTRYAMPVLLIVVILNPGHLLNHLFSSTEGAFANLVTG